MVAIVHAHDGSDSAMSWPSIHFSFLFCIQIENSLAFQRKFKRNAEQKHRSFRVKILHGHNRVSRLRSSNISRTLHNRIRKAIDLVAAPLPQRVERRWKSSIYLQSGNGWDVGWQTCVSAAHGFYLIQRVTLSWTDDSLIKVIVIVINIRCGGSHLPSRWHPNAARCGRVLVLITMYTLDKVAAHNFRATSIRIVEFHCVHLLRDILHAVSQFCGLTVCIFCIKSIEMNVSLKVVMLSIISGTSIVRWHSLTFGCVLKAVSIVGLEKLTLFNTVDAILIRFRFTKWFSLIIFSTFQPQLALLAAHGTNTDSN